jgi:hypothetical protein
MALHILEDAYRTGKVLRGYGLPPTLTERPNRQISDFRFTFAAFSIRNVARGKWLQELVDLVFP